MVKNYLQEFNEAKNSNNWTKATEIIENFYKNCENEENVFLDRERGRQIAEFKNAQDRGGIKI